MWEVIDRRGRVAFAKPEKELVDEYILHRVNGAKFTLSVMKTNFRARVKRQTNTVDRLRVIKSGRPILEACIAELLHWKKAAAVQKVHENDHHAV